MATHPSKGARTAGKPPRRDDEATQRLWQSFLTERGLNASKTRDAVVEVFLQTEEHIDLQSIFDRARQQNSGVSFATVYRTMKLLEEAGLAHGRRFGDARETLFEVAVGRDHHDHLICLSCGKIVEFVNDEVERLQEKVAAAHGYTLERHHLELFGTCPSCRGKKK